MQTKLLGDSNFYYRLYFYYEGVLMKNKLVAFILLIIFISLFIFSSIKVFTYLAENKENEEIIKEINTSINIENNTTNADKLNYIIDFESLIEKNSDTVVFLILPGTGIEYPVVQSDNNEFYLSHNFKKNINSAGWIFADYRNTLDGTDKNIIIYGHNMRNGKMFSKLKNYLNPSWYDQEDHKKIYFITPDGANIYEIFSVYEIEDEEYYLKTDFNSNEFNNYINTIKLRSEIDFNVNITSDDSIITLSTCGNTNDYRIVIHAKRTTN